MDKELQVDHSGKLLVESYVILILKFHAHMDRDLPNYKPLDNDKKNCMNFQEYKYKIPIHILRT